MDQLPCTLDWVVSLRVAALVQAQPHECYQSAWLALIRLPWLSEGWLVEGWAVDEYDHCIAVFEHGWLEVERAGKRCVIDPSILFLPRLATPAFFAGVRYTRSEAVAMQGQIMPHVRFDQASAPDGFGHRGYAQAFCDALSHAEARVRLTTKRLRVDRAQHESETV